MEGSSLVLRESTGDGYKYQNIIVGKVTPYKLVQLLSSLHQQKGLVLSNPIIAYLGGASVLLEKYGGEKAIEVMLLSASHCKMPWSFKYILGLAEKIIKSQQSEIGSLIEDVLWSK